MLDQSWIIQTRALGERRPPPRPIYIAMLKNPTPTVGLQAYLLWVDCL